MPRSISLGLGLMSHQNIALPSEDVGAVVVDVGSYECRVRGSFLFFALFSSHALSRRALPAKTRPSRSFRPVWASWASRETPT